MVGLPCLLLWATPTSAPAAVDASAVDEPAESTPREGPGLTFQPRMGYELTQLRLSRLRFSGLISGLEHDREAYDANVPRPDVWVHGWVARPNFVYQPSELPVQLTVGIHLQFGVGRMGAYSATNADGVLIASTEGQSVTILRGGLPVGMRVELGGVAMRATMVPGVGLVQVGDTVTGPGGERNGSAVAAGVLARGEVGLEVPVYRRFGLTLDGGHDLSLGAGWFFGAGVVLKLNSNPMPAVQAVGSR